MTPVPGWKVWATIVAVAVITFGIRFSFIYLLGRIEAVPDPVERALSLVPAAVLAALSIPAFVAIEPSVAATLANPRLLAGVAAGVVAWRTGDITATVVVGMATLWAIRFLP